MPLEEGIFNLTKGSRFLGVFQSNAVEIGPVPLPAPSAAGADGVALDVSGGVVGGESRAAMDTARRCAGAEMAAADALIEEGLPLGIDDLVRGGRWGQSDEMAVGVAERSQCSAAITVGIREVAEPRVQQRVAEDSGAVFAVAFVQGKHALIIARFRVEYEGREDREERRRGS